MSSKYRFLRSGDWSGGGAGLLGLAEYAVGRHAAFSDDSDAVPIIARNVPVRGLVVPEPHVLAPQNAWPWSHPDWHASEAPRILALRVASALHMRRASAVLRISSAIPVLGTPVRYSPVIHNVLDPGFETALEESAYVDASLAMGKIVCIGSVHSYRNFRRLIEAFELTGDGPGLLLCGPVGTKAVAESIETRVSTNPRVTVRWASLTRAECLAYFRASHCVVLPSLVEASPFTLLEALAVQPNVILSDLVGNREITSKFGEMAEANYFDALSVGSIRRALDEVSAAENMHRNLSNLSVREQARETWVAEVGDWLASLELKAEREQ